MTAGVMKQHQGHPQCWESGQESVNDMDVVDLRQDMCFTGKRKHFSLGISSINPIHNMICMTYSNSIFNMFCKFPPNSKIINFILTKIAF